MIPTLNIVAWGNQVPWAEQRQVEQDLIISRGIVAIVADPVLSRGCAFAVAPHSTSCISRPRCATPKTSILSAHRQDRSVRSSTASAA